MNNFRELIICILLIFTTFSNVYGYNLTGSFISTDKENVSLSYYSGNYVLIDAFATWCGPCELQMVHLQKVHETAGDQIVMLSISFDTISDTIEKVMKFKQKYEASWTFGIDDTSLNESLDVLVYPTTFVIDPQGNVLKKWIGITDSSEILSELDQYMELPGSFARKLNLAETLSNIFNGPGFFIFMFMFWTFLLYSGFRVIRIYFDKKQIE